MFKFILSLCLMSGILMAQSSASASVYKYTCFDLYNLYGNLRYTEFTGHTDYDMIKNMISGGDSGTLAITVSDDRGLIQGFDENFYDGVYSLEQTRSENSEISQAFLRIATKLNKSTSVLSMDLKNYKPADAPENLPVNSILQAALGIAGDSVTLDLMCGIESVNGVPFDWEK